MPTQTIAPPAARLPRAEIIQSLHGAYDAERQAWNLAADQRPDAVVTARTAQDVREIVEFARERGLKIAPQGTGHMGAALPHLGGTILLKTRLDDTIEIDPVARRARVGAGALWEDAVAAAAEHGLLTLHGSSPNVGIVGYSLGGGLSFLGRKYGLAANHVTAVEIVTADGEHVRADHDRHADLFWAVRGGGGNFGVVTALEFELFPLETVYAGAWFWPVEHAREVVSRWIEWTRTAPDAVTTSLRLLHLPPLPEVPEPLRNVPVVTIDGVVIGDEANGERILRDLRDIAPAMIDTWASVPAPALLELHGDPIDPTPAACHHLLLDELDDDAVEAFVSSLEPHLGSTIVGGELRQLGGALASAPADGGARASLDGSYAFFAFGVPPVPSETAAIDEALDGVAAALAPWDTGRVYLNFAERGGAADAAYSDDGTYARLAEIRAQVDPDELFVASHRIAPAR
jgi:FAD/FMN-containing dehydrogenase